MARTSEVPILIVGGGAVGTVLALELARRGVESRCIDKTPGPGAESRAIALHARTIELLNLVDPGLSERILDHTVWCKGYVMHFIHDGRRTEVRPGLDYTTLASRYNGIASQSQSTTQALIRDYTASRYGTQVEYNVRFEDLVQDGEGIVARVTHVDRDEEELIRCRYLVAGDGINSRVRRGLGLPVKETDYKGSFFQNLDAYLHGFTDWTDHFHYCVSRDHFLMVAPLPGGSFRLLLSDRGEAADPSIEPRQAFTRILEQHFDGVTIGDVVWHSRWETWVRLADTFREGNVFLAGDSAHVHSTTGGQGMNCCMQDAFNLGWKLALVVNGHADDGLLASYERERRPVAEQVIWAASSLHDIFMTHGKDIAQRRETMFEAGYQEKVVSYCSGIAYTYRDASGAVGPGTGGTAPRAGDRVPDLPLQVGTLFDRLRHPYYTLLVADGNPALATLTDDIQRRFPTILAIERLMPSPSLTEWSGDPSSVHLVRPDGYLAFTTSGASVETVDHYLRHTLGA